MSTGAVAARDRERNYSVVTRDDVATWVIIPAFAAATTVPNIIAAERIAAKKKPAVFMCILLQGIRTMKPPVT